jgi:adenylosuccinate lyase
MEMNLLKRYASPEMLELFSDENRTLVWRRIWIALARAQRECGLEIPEAAIAAMEAGAATIDLKRVAELERELRHDVMAHIHHFAEVAPAAKPYIHLGATSCDITDNADLVLSRDALRLLHGRLRTLLFHLRALALEHRNLPCLGYTHLQVAQPTTMGKRFCMYLADFLNDHLLVTDAWESLPLKGLKGATGTQASYLALFNGDGRKVRQMEERFLQAMGFANATPVVGQTYPRKMDKELGDILAGIAVSAGKMSRDFRVLQAFGEVAEPFGSKQVGSSAMPFKRNPMKMERVTSLSRYMLNLLRGLEDTAAEQFLERTLDDSALRRLTIPMGFFMADAVLRLCAVTAEGAQVRQEVIARRFKAQAPFLVIETLLMEWVKRGGDRQAGHEVLRQEALTAHAAVEAGKPNPLFKNLLQREGFPFTAAELRGLTRPRKLVGLAPQQVKAFVKAAVDPWLEGFTPGSEDVAV